MATKQTPIFDLNDLKPNTDVIVVDLLHPSTQDPLGMTVTVYSPFSKVYKQAQHEQVNKRIKAAQKNKKVDYNAEDIEKATLELMAKVTKEWSIVLGGKTPTLTVATAMEIYEEYPWIKDQVEFAITDTANFTKG